MVRRAVGSNIWVPDDRAKELFSLVESNPVKYIQRCYRVPEDETNLPIDFNLRYGQKDALRIFTEEWHSGKPVRLVFLKSRRVGLTTLFAALAYTHTKYRPIRAGVIAQNEFRAKSILRTMKFIRRNTKIKELIPRLDVDSNEALQMSHEKGGQFIVGTCNEPAKVRGDGLQWGHLSEWPWYGAMFNTTLNEICTTIAPRPYTVAVLEGTGKGRGSDAHNFWIDSRRRATQFRAHFLPWIDDPECIIPFDSEYHKSMIMGNILEIEPRLLEKCEYFKLTPEQIHYAWIEGFIHRCNRDYDYYCREFPFDEEEAWDSYGTSFFGDLEITKLAERCVEPTYFTFGDNFIDKVFKSFNDLHLCSKEPENDENGQLVIKLWAGPRAGRRYVIGSDSSMGERGGDFSSGYVIDAESREQMCAYRGRIRPHEHAFVMASLGWMYNTACLAPEFNPMGGGIQIIEYLLRLLYPNIYVWRIRDDKRGLVFSQKLGWLTNQSSRPTLLNEMRKMVIDAAHERFNDPGMFRDKQFIKEARTFQRDPETGRVEAIQGAYDDSIFGLAIAHRVAADEVYGSAQDIYASYDQIRNDTTPYSELLKHLEEIESGDDPCDVVNLLQDSRFNLNEGQVEWLD